MKKITLIIVIALISLTSFGQGLENQFYFRFGYSNPSWSQYGLSENDWQDVGFDKKVGASFEFGNIFMINSILKSENMSFGVNVDYLYVIYNNFSSGENGYEEEYITNFGSARIGSKIGPSFTYMVTERLAFDVYAKADFAWASAAVLYQDKIEDADDYYVGYVNVGFSTGLNIRYGALMLGVEYNTISPELENVDNEGEYLQNEIDESFGKNNSSKKSPLPSMNFTLGFSF